ncbi:hypothetical protein BKA82DRAFT_4360880 [Pisolithus tinctorius]|nr:hypothetical protein BKA82DRAFT_4360880 [Pisolithus tinctorius]
MHPAPFMKKPKKNLVNLQWTIYLTVMNTLNYEEVDYELLKIQLGKEKRDDLAKTLYSIHFTWLNEHINQPLCRDNFDTFIGLFNLPGPQNMMGRSNSLDQFCINFINK